MVPRSWTRSDLIILTIRTEILLRSLFSITTGENDPVDLKDLIKETSALSSVDEDIKIVLEAVCGLDNWQLTHLREKPEHIFEEIENCSFDRQWSEERRFSFKSILKFVASRNYFAHHSYKDTGLNCQISNLSGTC